jgi:hypothetical protein
MADSLTLSPRKGGTKIGVEIVGDWSALAPRFTRLQETARGLKAAFADLQSELDDPLTHKGNKAFQEMPPRMQARYLHWTPRELARHLRGQSRAAVGTPRQRTRERRSTTRRGVAKTSRGDPDPEPEPSEGRPSVTKCACGCELVVEQPLVGRPRLYSNEACKQRAARRRWKARRELTPPRRAQLRDLITRTRLEQTLGPRWYAAIEQDELNLEGDPKRVAEERFDDEAKRFGVGVAA